MTVQVDVQPLRNLRDSLRSIIRVEVNGEYALLTLTEAGELRKQLGAAIAECRSETPRVDGAAV